MFKTGGLTFWGQMPRLNGNIRFKKRASNERSLKKRGSGAVITVL
ncbi:MAG: hypothetical protein CM15mV127_310 [Caudoviricetes sp.]|nr:MAG: hypothetical protein CM15mV127_310 [Caudoviricetes sp.]